MKKCKFLNEVYYIEDGVISNSLYIDIFGTNIHGDEIATIAHLENGKVVEKMVDTKNIFATKEDALAKHNSKNCLIEENDIDVDKIKQYFLITKTYEGGERHEKICS